MFDFKNPTHLFLFIPLFLFFLYKIYSYKKNIPALQYPGVDSIKKVNKGIRSYLKNLPRIMLCAAMVLIIIALARPQLADTKIKRNVEGIDILIALDISDSMLIEDMSPTNRMESAKTYIAEFIKKRISDRIGLLVFSGESYTRVPLTLDYEVLLNSVNSIAISRDIKMGTAIGVALANAVARIKDSTAKSRIIILMTDGENNSGTIDPLTAIEIAKGYGIKVYSIGMGQDGQSQLPVYVTDMFGNQRKTYQPIHSSVNDELLGKMAEETGGKYFRSTSGNALEGVFASIDKLEKTKIEVNQYVKYNENFQTYLVIAFWLIALANLLKNSILRVGP